MGALIREVSPLPRHVAVEDDPLFGLIGLASDEGPTPHGDVAGNVYVADQVANEAMNERDPRLARRARRS